MVATIPIATGESYVSDTGAGAYASATGLWTVHPCALHATRIKECEV